MAAREACVAAARAAACERGAWVGCGGAAFFVQLVCCFGSVFVVIREGDLRHERLERGVLWA